MNVWTQIWCSVRQNKYFVAFEGAFTGVIFNFLFDGFTTHKIDLSRQGLENLAFTAGAAGLTAVRLLYRPAPNTNPHP